MRRLLAWLWKEWRDHRALLIGIGAAIPVLVVAAFVSFPERLGEAVLRANPAAGIASAADITGLFYVGAIALVVLAGASDLFGAEMQRGTLDLVRRTPRGMPLVFVAKVVFLAAMHVAALLWTAVVVALAWTVTSGADGFGAAGQALQSAPTHLALAAGFALSLWIALVSSWIPRGAAAVGAALLLLGLLLLPGYLLLREHPYVAEALLPQVPRFIAALAVLALVACAVSFLCGLRLRRGPWSAAWRGLAVVLVVFGGGYAYGANRLAAFLDFAPGDEDVGLFGACLGEGERHLYFNAVRAIRSGGRVSGKHSTPTRAFVLDLETGSVRRLREDPATRVERVEGARWPFYESLHRLEPAPVVVCSTYVEGDATAEAWIDGRTAALRKVYPPRFRAADTAEWLREGLRAATRVRDSEGRRAWIRPVAEHGLGVLEREGLPAPDRPAASALRAYAMQFAVSGGWWGLVFSRRSSTRQLLDASSGKVLPGPESSFDVLLSLERYLRLESRTGREHARGTWLVGEVASGDERPVLEPPQMFGYAASRDRMLAVRGKDERRLVLWDPTTGKDEDVRWVGEPVREFTGICCVGIRADRDLHLVELTNADPARLGKALAIFDPTARTIRVVTRYGHSVREPVAITDDGSLIAVEDHGTRIVRLRPNGTRDVLVGR